MNTLPATMLDTSIGANIGRAANRMPVVAPTNDPVKAREAAEELEAFFLSQVFETMFKGIKSDGMFGGGHGEDIFRPMLMQE